MRSLVFACLHEWDAAENMHFHAAARKDTYLLKTKYNETANKFESQQYTCKSKYNTDKIWQVISKNIKHFHYTEYLKILFEVILLDNSIVSHAAKAI